MSDSENDAKLSVPKFSSFKTREPAKTKADGVKDTKLSVPKFSSFKAKESPKADDDTRKDKDRRSSRDSHRDKRHRSHRHESRRRERDSRSHDKPPEPRPEAKSLPERSTSSTFVIDTKGDRLISKYGLDRAKVPAYYRHGGGKVLGTTGRLVIHRDGPRDQFSLRFPGESLGFFDRDGLRSKSFRPRRDPIRLRAKASTADDDEGYLAVGSSKKRKHDQQDAESEEDDGPSYRSIEGKAKPKSAFESDDESSESEDEVVDLEQDNPLKWKSIQLRRRVKEHPGDIDAWLELVDHQDDLQRAGETIDERTTANTAHSFSEIKVDMLESALSNAVVPEDRATVLVRLMREGMKIWTSKVATKKWAEVEKDEEGNFELWRAHVDFAMSNIATFQYDDIKQMLLARLRGILSRTNTTAEKNWEEAVYVFLRTTRYMHDSGYKELAVAAWQAMLELNFFKGVSEENKTEAIASFQDFWESEVPRLGDPESKGWKHYVSASGQVEAPEPRIQDAVEDVPTRDAYKAWGYSERLHAQMGKMPARTMDAGTEDDPFRVVMFSDIEPWLFTIPSAVLTGDVGKFLLDAFLIFCGLPPAYRSSLLAELAFTDQFTLRCAVIDTDLPTVSGAMDNPEEILRKPPSFSSSNANVSMSPSVLFSGSDWFPYFGVKVEDLPVEGYFVLNVLRQLVHDADMEGLALYYLGFSFAKDSALIKKAAKTVLKKYPNNADMYNAYALAEFANKNTDVGNKVLLSATESSSLSTGAAGFQLFKSLSWTELERGNKTIAIARLCSSVDKSLRQTELDVDSVSSTAILRTRQAITSDINECLYEGRVEDAAIYAEGLVLLSYLTDGGNLEPTSEAQGNVSAAMNTLTSMTTELKSRGYAGTRHHERILQFGAQILYLHATRGPFRRVYLRDQLALSLSWFPRNTIFLSLTEWADSSLRVIDETRQLLYDKIITKQHDCPSSRIFSIKHEISHGNTNTTKAAFEYALSSDVCRSSVGLWISYLRFGYARRELRPKVKEVFYRALRHCPWSKGVMMEAFGTLIRDMKSDELRGVYDTITAKGLRVHLDLEEFVDRWRKGRGDGK